MRRFLRRCGTSSGPTWMRRPNGATRSRSGCGAGGRVRLPDQWRAWIAVDGDEPIGEVFLQIVGKLPNPVVEPERLGYITSLYVVPGHRNAGVGGALLDQALDECRREGLDTVVLWPSSRSRPLYQRRGFVERGDVMELPLVPHPGRSA